MVLLILRSFLRRCFILQEVEQAVRGEMNKLYSIKLRRYPGYRLPFPPTTIDYFDFLW